MPTPHYLRRIRAAAKEIVDVDGELEKVFESKAESYLFNLAKLNDPEKTTELRWQLVFLGAYATRSAMPGVDSLENWPKFLSEKLTSVKERLGLEDAKLIHDSLVTGNFDRLAARNIGRSAVMRASHLTPEEVLAGLSLELIKMSSNPVELGPIS